VAGGEWPATAAPRAGSGDPERYEPPSAAVNASTGRPVPPGAGCDPAADRAGAVAGRVTSPIMREPPAARAGRRATEAKAGHSAYPQNGTTVSERKRSMKKVRYAAGALGAVGVMPALGLMAPAANAAIAQPAAATGKTVNTAVLLPDAAACTARHSHSSTESGGGLIRFRGYIAYSRDTGCIGQVIGHVYGNTGSGIDMRVRFYDNGLKKTQLIAGTINKVNDSISYSYSPFYPHAKMVCETPVYTNGDSVTSPACETTGYTG
jgi:hypothetical protein